MDRKVHLINLGCSKNQVDSEKMLGEMSMAGFGLSDQQEDAEVVVINTCGFIESAKEESIDEIMAAVQAKQPNQKIIVAGCLSERYKADLQNEIPEVDQFIGTFKPKQLLETLKVEIDPKIHCETGSLQDRILMGDEPHHAFVKIAEGCNRTCAFCAIPGMRGRQQSRGVGDIITEINQLHSRGIQEISLVAQDLTFYGRERGGPATTLQALLKDIIGNTDMPWIRLMYAYPAFLEDGLIDLMANEKRLCSYLDMPIQHSSDRMLKLMRRGHTRASLSRLLNKLRDGVPDIALRTTLLLGFPGETDDDFRDLLDLVEEFRFDRLGCFTYSDEDGTHAFDSKEERVDVEVAMERAQTIMDVQREISLERNESLVGKELDVFIDSVAEGSEYHFYARTQWDAPEVDNRVLITEGSATPGTFRKVLVTDCSEYDLEAELLEE